jgi:hypothetical protein
VEQLAKPAGATSLEGPTGWKPGGGHWGGQAGRVLEGRWVSPTKERGYWSSRLS